MTSAIPPDGEPQSLRHRYACLNAPKAAPHLILSIVLTTSSLSIPSSSAALFGRDAPLVAEIGVGSGRFIEAISEGHPEWNVLGIDRAPDSVVRTFRRLHRAGIENARVMKADATFVLRDVVPRHGLHALYINFPDPWPRRKHHRRRLLQMSMLRLLSSRLTPQGRILLTSDHPEFFEFACHNARASGLYRVNPGDAPPEALETKYARKWKERDLRIHHAALIVTAEEAGHDVEVETPDEMYHAVLTGELPDLEGFESLTHAFKNGSVVVKEVYRALDEPGYAFLVHVAESGLSQEIVVEARKSRSGYVVGVKRFGEPLQTRGVRHAVRFVSGWLQDRGMALLHEKY